MATVFALQAALSAETPSSVLFRIFLTDGTALVSYGEYSRVAGRVVFSVPVGDLAGEPVLQVLSISEAAVDWHKTDAYASAVRAKRYAETRGEDEFALLIGQVTVALTDLSLTADPALRLAKAEEARRRLAAWPAANHGFKAAEVAHLVSLFDDAIAELQAAAGQRAFDLTLVAMTLPPPGMDLLPVPDRRTTLELAFQAALRAADPAEKGAALRALQASLQAVPPDAAWAKPLQARVSGELAAEVRIDTAYSNLAADALKAAEARAVRGDVQGLQAVIARALRQDEALGRKRPGETAALLATLDLRVAEARQIRLAREASQLRVDAVKVYQKAIVTPLERMGGFRRWLESIRSLAGPELKFLKPLEERARLAHLELSSVTPPAEARAAHQLFAAALHLTRHAAALRREAVSSNDSKLAWDASAAAAGAITLGERAVDELHRLISTRRSR
ncbi:MAG TPA: hypothetical protein VM364_08615 [Vicinamibacterales bacterium]|nr:hypothetical protein [Vicinamibacterales bacterium]